MKIIVLLRTVEKCSNGSSIASLPLKPLLLQVYRKRATLKTEVHARKRTKITKLKSEVMRNGSEFLRADEHIWL